MKQTRKWMMVAILAILCSANVLTSYTKDDDSVVAPAPKLYFTSWNECQSLTALKEYVEDVTNPKSANYIPAEDRIATFDMDGTFVGELYPTILNITCWSIAYSMTLITRIRLPTTCARRPRISATLCATVRLCPHISI